MRLTAPAALLTTATLLAAPLALEGLTFAPKSGTSLSKTFSTSIEVTVEELDLLVNGEDQSAAMGGESPVGKSMTFEEELVVEDTYDEVADGRPTSMVRKFVSMEDSQSGDLVPEENMESDGFSELEGLSVRATWDEDAEEYDLAFEDGEGDEDLLEKIGVDMDMLALLPADGAEAGDSWTIPVEQLDSLLAPGRAMEGDDEQLDMLPDEVSSMLEDTFDDMEVECSFEEIVERDGVELAMIQLELEFDEMMDVSDLLMDVITNMGELPEGLDASIDVADISLACSGEGVLLWNLEAGRFQTMEFEMEAEIEVEIAGGAEMGGQLVADVEMIAALSLTMTREASAD